MFQYGCFVCGKGKSAKLKGKCAECGAPFDVASLLLSCQFGEYKPIRELGRGFYGTVLLAKNRIGREFALKVCSSALYLHRQKSFTEELEKYMRLGDHPNIAELFDGGEANISIMSQTMHVYFLATKYIPDAVTLDAFIDRDEFGVEEMIGITVQICAAICRVEGQDLWHNDLHGRNILLAPRMVDDYDHHPTTGRSVVKVVDFGSAGFQHPWTY